jgi:hypothetical protein
VSSEERLRQEVLFLARNLHWGYSELMDMPTSERWAYVRLLGERLEQEQQAIRSARGRG